MISKIFKNWFNPIDRRDNSTSTKMEYRNLDAYSEIPFEAKYDWDYWDCLVIMGLT